MSETPPHRLEAAAAEGAPGKPRAGRGWMRSRRFWCSLVGLGLLVACAIPLGSWGLREFRINAYYRDAPAGRDMINQILHRRPPDVDAHTWGTAWSWTITAYHNVCFSPNHVPHDELRRFLADLEERLRGPVDLATWDWVWDRLGRTGPHGRSYQQKYEWIYRMDIREHLERAGATQEPL